MIDKEDDDLFRLLKQAHQHDLQLARDRLALSKTSRIAIFVIRYARPLLAAAVILFAVVVGTGAASIYSMSQQVDHLSKRISDLGLDKPVRLTDSQAFQIDGNDRIKVHAEVNPAFIRKVVVRWGTDAGDADKYEWNNTSDSMTAQGLKVISQKSPPLKYEGGFRYITATLEIEAYPDIPENVRPLLLTEPHRRKFLVTPHGIVADPPEKLPVATLSQIKCEKHPNMPNLYLLTGQIHPQMIGKGADLSSTMAFLVIAPSLVETCTIGARLDVSPDGHFISKCFLGPARLDHEKYQMYVVVAARADVDATEMIDGSELPRGVNWQKRGFVRSEYKTKLNDGKDGFSVDMGSK